MSMLITYWPYFGYVGKLLKLIAPIPFYLYNVATRKFKITHVAHIKFLSGGTGRRDLCVLEKNKREWYIKNTYRKHS